MHKLDPQNSEKSWKKESDIYLQKQSFYKYVFIHLCLFILNSGREQPRFPLNVADIRSDGVTFVIIELFKNNALLKWIISRNTVAELGKANVLGHTICLK